MSRKFRKYGRRSRISVSEADLVTNVGLISPANLQLFYHAPGLAYGDGGRISNADPWTPESVSILDKTLTDGGDGKGATVKANGINGKKVVCWLESNSEYVRHDETGGKSVFNFLHDGGSFSFLIHVHPNVNNDIAVVFTNHDRTTGKIGTSLQIDDRTSQSATMKALFNIMTGGGLGTEFVTLTTSNNFIENENWNILIGRFEDGHAGNDFLLDNGRGTEEGVDATAQTPSGSDSSDFMTFGNTSFDFINNPEGIEGDMTDMIFWNTRLTDDQVASLKSNFNDFYNRSYV